MFDDAPQNLPTGDGLAPSLQPIANEVQLPEAQEPPRQSVPPMPGTLGNPDLAEDPFEGIDTGSLPSPSSSALDVGAASVTAMPKRRGNKGLLVGIVAIIVLLGVAVGLAFAFGVFRRGSESETIPQAPSVGAPTPTRTTTPNVERNEGTVTITPTPVLDDKIVPPQPVDSDGDGLSDVEEAGYGTSARKPDTDNDGLFDREEIQVYGTNPLNPDTDGDSYMDGEEVSNGYDPNGSGKLFEVPRE
ncbi:MAG: thrombospondin type 3 repeat-containing protein [Patescibacteria group bacterium]